MIHPDNDNAENNEMNERDYINVCDLTRIRSARNILGGICTDIQPSVPAIQLRSVLSKLEKWDESIVSQIGDLDESDGESIQLGDLGSEWESRHPDQRHDGAV